MQNSYCQINKLYIIAAIFFIGLLTILFIFGYTPTNDGEGYIENARICLSEGQPYPTNTIYKTAPFVWNIGIINITELSLWLFDSVKPLLVLFCLFKALTALFISLTAQRLFGYRTAILCITLFALYPNNWGQSTMISSEIPSTMLAVMAVYLIVCHKKYFLAGLALALSNWFRPTATIFLIAIILYILLFYKEKKVFPIAKLIAGFSLLIAIVGTSCYLRTGKFIYQARSYWFSMVDECYDGAEVAPHWNQPIWPKGTPRFIENHENMDCFQYEKIWKERSITWLKDNKLAYLSKIPGRIYYMYQSDYDNMPAFLYNKSDAASNYITIPFKHLLSEYKTILFAQWISLFAMIFYGCLLLMAIINTVKLIKCGRKESLFLPLFIVIGGTLALVLVMHGETRFKDPLMPFVFILSSANNYYEKQ